MSEDNRSQRSRKAKKKRKVTKLGILVLGIILIPAIIYVSNLLYILYFAPTPTFVDDPIDVVDGEKVDIPEVESSGIDNIVLFGVDSREAGDHGRTDSIIIASINKDSKVIKLTSIMRDLYVEIPSKNKHMDRINSAYSIGGPELALKTINDNFGLDIKYYAIIDFKAFQELVDQVGGIEVEVKDYEVNEINHFITEINGKDSTLLKKAGFQHINGQQALSYARIRKVGNGDYERTERQRIVLKALAEKAKQTNILKMPQLLTTLASYIQTNIPMSKIVSLGVTAYGFDGGMQTMRVPIDGYFNDQNVNGAAVLVPDIKSTAQLLKEFIYDVTLTGNKDVPSYMQNNFHMDDTVVVASKPKANIPDYRTPEISMKSEDELEATLPTPISPDVSQPDSPGEDEEDNTNNPTVTPTKKPGQTPTPPKTSPGATPTPSTSPTPTPTGIKEPTPTGSYLPTPPPADATKSATP
ncbi:regulatory protein MsrR [Oxobacter pfennigii]|uniref:Regulatory protein MsrR n=1 Tax=Oxobacter pfennigii TaxID=36849 RepID=A0A0P8W7Q0_9CLOT|nr:LCP family protein [Oxobacter pfennigii]KPU44071.1 regulatory protein MsrR [Oxobacter pfennigii]